MLYTNKSCNISQNWQRTQARICQLSSCYFLFWTHTASICTGKKQKKTDFSPKKKTSRIFWGPVIDFALNNSCKFLMVYGIKPPIKFEKTIRENTVSNIQLTVDCTIFRKSNIFLWDQDLEPFSLGGFRSDFKIATIGI